MHWYLVPVTSDNIVNKIPNYKLFGRPATLQLNPNKIPDLGWQMSTTLNTTPDSKYQVPGTKDLTVVSSQIQSTIVTT